MRHAHRKDETGRGVGCRQILTLTPQPAGTGGSLRIVFPEGPGRYVPGGGYSGSGDVGFISGSDLNLHEPGAVRALLEVALIHGWRPKERRPVEIDGWPLLDAAVAMRANAADPEGT
ncbi:hypothetical protein [Streptomyces yangpuensis]